MFNKQEYIGRRSVLQSKFKSGLLVFMGNADSPMNYKDNCYHFRQDSTFLYYFGIKEPDLTAVMDIDNNKTVVFGNEMSIDAIVWMGRQKTLGEKAGEVGLNELQPTSAFETYLKNAQAKGQEIKILPPYRADNKIRLAETLSVSLKDLAAKFVAVDFIKAVVAQRSVKSALEIAELHRASDISADMHLLAMQLTRPGMTEAEVASIINQVAEKENGHVAYPIILTINGQILHNHYHGNIIKDGDLVLNDAGAETVNCYAGDLTRTYPGGKKFSALQRDMYNLVLQSYHDGVAMLKPGVRFLDVHYRCCLTLAEGLKEMGLMKGDMEEAVQQGAHAMFFQCGTGHMMGMDVHDMEDLGEQYVGYTDELKKETQLFGLKSLRLGKAVEEGYVLTVEPGLYFIPELMDRWQATRQFADFLNYEEIQKLRDFGGIRLEDDYVITSSGHARLGKGVAISVNDVEQIRDGAY